MFSPEAEEDILLIYEHIAPIHPSNAEQFIDDIIQQIFQLAQCHNTGVSREWIRPGLRLFPYRKRCIYFRIEHDTLYVLRVLHSSQDIALHFP